MNKKNLYLLSFITIITPSAYAMKQEDQLSWSLVNAVKHGTLLETKELIEKGAKINYISPFGETPLVQAAYNGNIEIIEFLIEKKADVNFQGAFGTRPIMHAKNKKIINLLLKNGAEINVKNKNGDTALIFNSLSASDLDIAKTLIESGIDINAKSNLGVTSLRIASSNGNLDLIKYLLKNGVNASLKDNNSKLGLNAFEWAKMNCSNSLLESDIIKYQNVIKIFEEALFDAIKDNNYIRVLDLVKTIKKLKITDNNGNNVLHYAVAIKTNNEEQIKNKNKIIALIISFAKNLLTQKNNNKLDPIEYSISSGHFSFQLFLALLEKSNITN